MIEFGDAWRTLQGWSVHQAFWLQSAAHRGPHWDIGESSNVSIRTEEESIDRWIDGLFAAHKPDVVIVGTATGEAYAHAVKLGRRDRIRVGCWLEQPFPPGVTFGPAERFEGLKQASQMARPLYSTAKRMAYRRTFSRSRPDFVLAIGDRAFDFYRKVTPSDCWVADFPYFQDLNFALGFEKSASVDITRFVFSGQMVPRNNWANIVAAFGRLSATHPGHFVLRVSASGDRHYGTTLIETMAEEAPGLLDHISFDAGFSSWDDRLVPLGESDVLVAPSLHHGWGLVVPEGMASGCAVISTRGVESARRLVQPAINGLMCDGTASMIYDCIRFCVEHPEWLKAAQSAARSSVLDLTSEAGAKRAASLFSTLRPSNAEPLDSQPSREGPLIGK